MINFRPKTERKILQINPNLNIIAMVVVVVVVVTEELFKAIAFLIQSN